RSIWANALAAGVERLVFACVVETHEDLDAYRRAIPGAQVTVCQLVAPEQVRKSRLRRRELGAGLEWHLQRTEELRQILENSAVHDFSVINDDRSVLDVAYEALARAAWPVGQP